MNFLSNEVKTTLTFSPLLRTREQVTITAYFVILGNPKLTYYLPFVPTDPYLARITADLTQLAQASASRWALGFPSAEDCLTKESYASLESEFRNMESPEFRVSRATVTNIIPLTPRLEKLEKISPGAQRVKELTEATADYDEVKKALELEIQKRPTLFDGSKHGERIKARWEHESLDILLNRRG
jgi:hypothetical protein